MKSYSVHILAGKENTCGAVTIFDSEATSAGRLVHADEWIGEPLERFLCMCEKNGLKLVENWKSSVGNFTLTFGE